MVMCSQVSVYPQGGRHAWQGVCVAGACMVWGVGGRKVCMRGGMCGRGVHGGGVCVTGGCAWQERRPMQQESYWNAFLFILKV